MKAELIALLAGVLTLGAPQVPHPQIGGSWVMNEKESQRPQESRGGQAVPSGPTTPSLVAGGGGGGGRRGGGAGGGGRSGGGGRGSSNPAMQLRQAIGAVFQSGTSLIIEQQDTALSFIDSGGAPIKVRTNGKSSDIVWGQVGEVETKAEWTKEGLVLERKFDGGVKVRELYQRTPDSPKLTIITTVSSKALAEDLTFKRVYDPAPAK